MVVKKKGPDDHTQKLIEAMERWEQHGKGGNIFICDAHQVPQLVDRGRNFLAGKYPVLSSHHMRMLTMGNKLDGTANGIGFYIIYQPVQEFRGGNFERLRGQSAHVTILEDSMAVHVLNNEEMSALLQTVNLINSREA